MFLKKNYFANAFFWATLSKLLNALVGFVSVPLLLGFYGKANYGILSLATACNGYMHLLDLGMNVGAVKFFAQWKEEGKQALIYRVANTNITFYGIIAIVNAIGLLLIAFWGEPFFNIDHEHFMTLKSCLIIIALFTPLSWLATPFSQLLIADKRFSYVSQMQAIIPVLKVLLIALTLHFKYSLTFYFFALSGITALLIIPYAIKCKTEHLILNIFPRTYWNDFKIVLFYSLSIFAMSLFQATSTQTRPIFLGIFASNGADAVADFNIIASVPLFVTMLGGSLTSIFIPKTSEMVARNNPKEIKFFSYKWTVITSILMCSLCFPFIIGARNIINAYVGSQYSYLTIWMSLWLFIVILQMHSSPCYSLILAYGKTKKLVVCTGITCLISIIINCSLAKMIGAASAVIGYATYIILALTYNYTSYYKDLLHLNRWLLFKNFITPVFLAVFCSFVINILDVDSLTLPLDEKTSNILLLGIKAILWIVLYFILIIATGLVRFRKGTFIIMNGKYEN